MEKACGSHGRPEPGAIESPRCSAAADRIDRGLYVIIAAGFARSLIFILSTGDAPWIYPRLAIDGASYLRIMNAVPRLGFSAAFSDLMHSPGYGFYLTLLRRLCFGPSVFRVVKLSSWAFGVLCALMMIRIGKSFGRHVGSAAAAMFAWSYRWMIYCCLLQYDTQAAAFLTLAVFATATTARTRRGLFAQCCLVEIALIAAVVLHWRFAVCWAVGAFAVWLLMRRQSSTKAAWTGVVLYAGVVVLPLFGLLSANRSAAAKTLDAGRGFYWVGLIANDPVAVGYPMIGKAPRDVEGKIHPEARLVEPSGLAFVLARPRSFAALTYRRFLLIWDVEREYWSAYGDAGIYFPWRHPLWLSVFQAGGFLLFAAGVFLKRWKSREGPREPAVLFAEALVPACLIFPLLSYGSSRYLIPVLPIVFIYEAYALLELLELAESMRRGGGSQGPRPT